MPSSRPRIRGRRGPWEKALGIIVVNYVVARLLFLALLRAARRPADDDDRPSQRLYNIGKAFVELKRREIGHRRRRGDDPVGGEDRPQLRLRDGRSVAARRRARALPRRSPVINYMYLRLGA